MKLLNPPPWLRRHGLTLATAALGAVAALAGLAGFAIAAGVSMFAAIATAAGQIFATEQALAAERHAALDAEAERFEEELVEMRRIAFLARGVLLETELWRDFDAISAHIEAQRANPGKVIDAPPSWTVNAIIARGADALEPRKVRDWTAVAQCLRSNAAHLTSLIDQQFPGQPAERRSELKSVYRASEKAAESADGLRSVVFRRSELNFSDDARAKREADDALRDLASGFVLALEWMQGSIEQIERSEQFAREIEKLAREDNALAES